MQTPAPSGTIPWSWPERTVPAPSGKLIMTMPAAYSDGLLKFLSGFTLISKEEVNKYVFAYMLPLLGWYFGTAGFSMHKVHFG